MSENEYVLLSDVVKIRNAIHILSDCSGNEKSWKAVVIPQLLGVEDQLRKQIKIDEWKDMKL